MFIPFDPQPPHAEVPTVFPSPFQPDPPGALATRAMRETRAFLEEHPVFSPDRCRGRFGGKMHGVLVVEHRDGRLGYLRGFAGMADGIWEVDGFVPAVFGTAAFEDVWGPGGAHIAHLDARVHEAQTKARDGGDPTIVKTAQARRAEASRETHRALLSLYALTNGRGEVRMMADMFAPHVPPGGAGDCAGVKLIQYAHTHGLRPVAMAEFWWGASPPSGGRHHGVVYPACRGRCGTILPFMLEGVALESPPDVGLQRWGPDAPRVLHEDADLFVVDKPSGMLSVPGRGKTRQDCVERRLQRRAEQTDPSWPRMVHRLDLATSGVMVVPRHKEAYVNIQRQFSRRTITKRYLALVEGCPRSDSGLIELPLGRDLADRPRQLVDRVDGKPARTRWEILERADGYTRVAMYPETGRTHQLRVHAAHPEGLGTPIVGDRLYGFPGARLMLHAEQISLAHPRTGAPVSYAAQCPF